LNKCFRFTSKIESEGVLLYEKKKINIIPNNPFNISIDVPIRRYLLDLIKDEIKIFHKYLVNQHLIHKLILPPKLFFFESDSYVDCDSSYKFDEYFNLLKKFAIENKTCDDFNDNLSLNIYRQYIDLMNTYEKINDITNNKDYFTNQNENDYVSLYFDPYAETSKLIKNIFVLIGSNLIRYKLLEK